MSATITRARLRLKNGDVYLVDHARKTSGGWLFRNALLCLDSGGTRPSSRVFISDDAIDSIDDLNSGKSRTCP